MTLTKALKHHDKKVIVNAVYLCIILTGLFQTPSNIESLIKTVTRVNYVLHTSLFHKFLRHSLKKTVLVDMLYMSMFIGTKSV